MKTYKNKDLDNSFIKTIEAAKQLWKSSCEENYKKYGDEGSCVIGAGICIYFIPPKCRNPTVRQIISSNEVSCAQGSLNWERGLDEVIEFLSKNWIEAKYIPGYMD